MKFESISKNNTNELLALFIELWPEDSNEDHAGYVRDVLNKDHLHAVLARSQSEYIGFIYLSLRSDFVPGATHYPVAYIEGIYIRKAYRKKGIASHLVQMAEDWGKGRGSKQIASDVEIDNIVSQDFHLNLGFVEEERVISYIKSIG